MLDGIELVSGNKQLFRMGKAIKSMGKVITSHPFSSWWTEDWCKVCEKEIAGCQIGIKVERNCCELEELGLKEPLAV